MKIKVCLILLCIASLSYAQTVVLQENFTTYDGTSGTTPPGWYLSSHGNYTSSGYSGTSGPNAYQFSVNAATLITPPFTPADTVSFWLKRSSAGSALNLFVILESPDSLGWDTLAYLDTLPTSGASFSFGLSSSSKYLKFAYYKVSGNIAFDDFLLLQNNTTVNTAKFMTNASVKIFPNPVTFGRIYITGLTTVSHADITISDMQGRKIVDYTNLPVTETVSLETTGWPFGIYLLEIQQGDLCIRQKIVLL